MGEDPLLEPGDEHGGELEALGGVHRHHGHGVRAAGEGVEVAAEREPFEQRGKRLAGERPVDALGLVLVARGRAGALVRGVLPGLGDARSPQLGQALERALDIVVRLLELGGDAQKLADVLDAALRLDGALGRERLDEAGHVDDALDDALELAVHAPALAHDPHEVAERAAGLGREAPGLGACELARLEERAAALARERVDPLDRIRASPPAVALDLGELRGIDRLARRQAHIGGRQDRHPHVFAPPGNAVGVDALRPPVGERTNLAFMTQIDHDPCVGTALRLRDPKLVTRAVISVDDAVRHRRAVARRRIRVHGHLLVRHETRIALAGGKGERHGLGSRRHSRCGAAHLDREISLVRTPDIKRLPRSAVDAHLQPLDNLAVLEVDAVGAIVALDHDATELALGNIDGVDHIRTDELDLDVVLGRDRLELITRELDLGFAGGQLRPGGASVQAVLPSNAAAAQVLAQADLSAVLAIIGEQRHRTIGAAHESMGDAHACIAVDGLLLCHLSGFLQRIHADRVQCHQVLVFGATVDLLDEIVHRQRMELQVPREPGGECRPFLGNSAALHHKIDLPANGIVVDGLRSPRRIHRLFLGGGVAVKARSHQARLVAATIRLRIRQRLLSVQGVTAAEIIGGGTAPVTHPMCDVGVPAPPKTRHVILDTIRGHHLARRVLTQLVRERRRMAGLPHHE